jgi:hypothetical protein
MIYWQGKTEELGEKPVPVPLRPPEIPYRLTRARTRASAVRDRRLTIWAMARPPLVFYGNSRTSWTSWKGKALAFIFVSIDIFSLKSHCLTDNLRFFVLEVRHYILSHIRIINNRLFGDSNTNKALVLFVYVSRLVAPPLSGPQVCDSVASHVVPHI